MQSTVGRWLVAGALVMAGALGASAQAVVPQYTHRGFIGAADFDAEDARVAVASSGGFVSVVDVASGRVLAVRRLLRSNEAFFSELRLDGPVVRAFGSIAGDSVTLLDWNWVDDSVNEREPAREGYFAARSPEGRLAIVAEDGRLHVVRRSTAIEGRIEAVAFPHRRVVVVQAHERPLEVRSARDPERVLVALRGRGMSFDARRRRVATVDGDHVRIATLPGGALTERAHGLGLAAKRVVFGPRALAVVGDDRSELHVDGAEPVAMNGAVEWIGRRTAIVRRGLELLRVRVADMSERVMVRDDADQVWVGERGAVLFRHEEMDRFTVVRRNGGRRRYAPGGEHSVWHVHAAPSGDAVVLAGRFGIQRWTANGVVDGRCNGEALLGVDWESEVAYGQFDRCDARGRTRRYPANATAMAATEDGRTVFLSNGRFFGRSRPRARVRDLVDPECEGPGLCAWQARFAAKGNLLVIESNPDWGQEGIGRLVRVRDGRTVMPLPLHRSVVVSEDGSRIAITHARGGRVHDASDGRELFSFGASDPGEADVHGPVAFSADGARLAWTPRPGVVEVLDGTGNRQTRVEVGSRPTVLALTADAIAIGTSEGTRLVRGGTTQSLAAGVGPTSAACVEGRFRTLSADLRVTTGPRCNEGVAERRGDLYFRKTGGAVRIWHGERVMTLRTLRRGTRPTHMAYTSDGRWWSSDASPESREASDSGDAPFALRVGLASRAARGSSDDSLLGELFHTPDP